MSQNIYIFSKCCSFELSIHERFLEKKCIRFHKNSKQKMMLMFFEHEINILE